MKAKKSHSSRASFPIVGIGASAGGLAAFIELLSALPADSGMAFVLVQHLDPSHTSLLPEALARATPMKVAAATEGAEVRPDHVYVIPPNADLALEGNALRLVPREDARKPHLSIDFFFRSLAGQRGAQAIGVVLSGSGSDGTEGLRAIKAEGGIAFVQDPQTAKFGDMPQSAISAGVVDTGMSIAALARELVRLSRHPYLAAAAARPPAAADEGGFEQILELVRRKTGVDFTEYKRATIERRTARRMALRGEESLQSYLRLLQSDDGEALGALRGRAHPRHLVLPRAAGVRRAGEGGPSADPREEGEGRADPRVGRGLLDRRGGLLAGHRPAREQGPQGELPADPDLRLRREREGGGEGARRRLLRARRCARWARRRGARTSSSSIMATASPSRCASCASSSATTSPATRLSRASTSSFAATCSSTSGPRCRSG